MPLDDGNRIAVNLVLDKADALRPARQTKAIPEELAAIRRDVEGANEYPRKRGSFADRGHRF